MPIERLPHALRHSPGVPAAPADDPASGDDLDLAAGDRLLCRVCGEAVTAEAHRTSIAGRHTHRRSNPWGIDFVFGCFHAAPGARVEGQPTAEFTWFPGYCWDMATCRGCAAHLGWFFDGGEATFFGLILDRLESEGL